MMKKKTKTAAKGVAAKKGSRVTATPQAAVKKAPAKSKVAAKKAPAKSKVATKKAPTKSKVAAKKAPGKPTVAAKKGAAKRTAKKAALPAAKPSLAKTAGRTTPVRRRDGAGHLDPTYAAELRARIARPEEDGEGFIRRGRSRDDLAEVLGEEVVATATTGEAAAEDILDQEVPEERGGPFVRSSGGIEFAEGTDRSNPKGAKREPFPTT
jgi:hypothetical protein